jgi:hypothetical protein
VIGGSVSVLTNGEESNTFKTGKGLRQGDPLSPLLFNFVGDVLNRMLWKAARGLIAGLLQQFRPGGIVALQYADDTLLFSSDEPTLLKNMKGILMLFERVSGMRINFHKSEVIPLNMEEDMCHEIAHPLNCPLGSLPFKYIGVPLHFDRLKREDIQPLIDKMIKRLLVGGGDYWLIAVGRC